MVAECSVEQLQTQSVQHRAQQGAVDIMAEVQAEVGATMRMEAQDYWL